MHGAGSAPVAQHAAGCASHSGAEGCVLPLHPQLVLTHHSFAAELIRDQQADLLSFPPWQLLSQQEALRGELLWGQLLLEHLLTSFVLLTQPHSHLQTLQQFHVLLHLGPHILLEQLLGCS